MVMPFLVEVSANADEKSLFLFFSFGLDFGVLSLLPLSLFSVFGYMYGVLPLKFSIKCLFPYFLIIRLRFLFISSIISLYGSSKKLRKTFLRLVVSSSSSTSLKYS